MRTVLARIALSGAIISMMSMGAVVATAGPEQEAADTGPMVITWLGNNNPGVIPPEGGPAELDIERRYKVDLKPVQVDARNVEAVNVLLASGEVPDYHYKDQLGDLERAVRGGVARSFDRDLFARHAPYLYGVINEMAPDGEAWRKNSFGGELYGIPVLNNVIQAGDTMVTRKDWLDALADVELELLGEEAGVRAYVQASAMTLDEFGDLLERYHTGDPDGNGRRDTYALSDDGSGGLDWESFPYVFGAFGLKADSFMKRGDGVEWANITDDFRLATKVLADWYARGIIDPEFVVDNAKANREKAASGVTGFHTGGSSINGLRVDKVPGMMVENNPGLDVVYLLPPVGPDGRQGSAARSPVREEAGAFGPEVTDAKMIRVFEIFDGIHSDREQYQIHTRGFEGVHFDMVDGEAVMREDYVRPEGRMQVPIQYFILSNWIDTLASEFRMPDWRRIPYEVGLQMPRFLGDLDPALVTVYGRHANELSKIEDQFFFDAVQGKLDVDAEWDAYVARWMNAGGSEVMAEANQIWSQR